MNTAELTKQENGVTTPDSMIMLAIEQNLDIDKLERLMDLKERYDKQQAMKAFKLAFAGFQKDKPELVKTSDVKYGNTQYGFLPLPKIQKAIDPVLSNHGLSYRWEQKTTDKEISITCIVSHSDGHEERTTLSAGADNSGGKNAIQAIGSTVSYLKRYTLEAALGLSTDKDNDGAGAGKEKKLPELTPESPKWNGVIDALKADQITIKKLKEKYFTLSEETETKLKEALV